MTPQCFAFVVWSLAIVFVSYQWGRENGWAERHQAQLDYERDEILKQRDEAVQI